MLHGKAQSDRSAIIEAVNGKSVQPDPVDGAVDHTGQCIEALRKVAPCRRTGVANVGQVGCDHLITVRQRWDQIAEHAAGGREAMKQNGWRVRLSSLAVKDIDVANRLTLVTDGDDGSFHSATHASLAVLIERARLRQHGVRPHAVAQLAPGILAITLVSRLKPANQ
ncbi:hypothetical protein [Sphingomonas sp. UV9]|uniref:hypothetical protein n=1 Tax=Sphingomonas sp. UV9 TaxID=1851410 RepID=UPI001F0CD8FE|nr:hypothetical protein [Sphingomonas sp. UV9]